MKGDEIRFVAGKYESHKGWINVSDYADDETTPVIVNLGLKKGAKEGLSDGLKVTFVKNSSFKKATDFDDPNKANYAWAAIQQCPDVERDLVKVTRQMAKCDVDRDQSGFVEVFSSYLGEAVEMQKKKGSKALYRAIIYEDDDVDY